MSEAFISLFESQSGETRLSFLSSEFTVENIFGNAAVLDTLSQKGLHGG